jgi:uncharacterized Zn-binding protein involved in type VI secretion
VRAGSTLSTPALLDGSWQALGISVPAHTGPIAISVDTVSAWQRGDELLLDDVGQEAAPPSTSGTIAGTRVITVNGRPQVIQGYTYWVTSIGDQWPATTWARPATCQNDARLLAGMGVNTLRVMYEDHAVPELYRQCLDAFWAQHIGVVWIIDGPAQVEVSIDGDAWRTLYEQKLASAVAQVGGHPATYMWLIGNEIERGDNPSSPLYKAWFGQRGGIVGYLDHFATFIRALDPGRLVGTALSGGGWMHWLSDANVPSLQVWGLNHYVHGENAAWYDWLSSSDPRPKFFTEFGVDRFRCAPGTVQAAISGGSLVESCRTAGSGEDQIAQARWAGEAWDAIAANLATPDHPQGALSGGLFFGWSDQWWFSLGAATPMAPMVHDVAGVTPWAAFDGVLNTEWLGVSFAQPPTATTLRGTALAADELASRWSSAPLPRLTGVTVKRGMLCAATLRWTTSEPATSEVQRALDIAQTSDEMTQDSAIYQPLAYDPEPVRDHAVKIRVPASGARYVARSFTVDGRSATAAPRLLSCPAG